MTAITFDTLQASRRLRDAGVDERTAEAIVEVVSQTTELPDISKLATKADLELLEMRIRKDTSEQMRGLLMNIFAGVAAIVGLATAIIKLV